MIIFDVNDPLVTSGTYDQEGYKPGERARIAKRRAADEERGRLSMAKATTAPKPKQADLPGTDGTIKPLEDIAEAYADVRDRRIALNREEGELKTTALNLMHKFDKTIYRHNGIEIRLVPGEEDVKVKVKKPEDDVDDSAPADVPGATFEAAE